MQKDVETVSRDICDVMWLASVRHTTAPTLQAKGNYGMLSQKLLQQLSSVEALQVGVALGGAPAATGYSSRVDLPRHHF